EHDPRDAGHADTADADEVHPAEGVGGGDLEGEVRLHDRARRALASPASATARSTRSASRSSPSVMANAAAALPMAASSLASTSRGTSVSLTHCGVHWASSTRIPPPASTTGSALKRCSPLPIGSGTYAAGSPTVVSSQTVPAPARQTTASAAAYARSIRSTYSSVT